jgi:hypothetical protein
MAETSRERIEQRRIALSVIATAVNYVSDGLAIEEPAARLGPASREDWLRVLDRARETVEQLDREARKDLQRADRRRR